MATIQELISQLKSNNPDERKAAVNKLSTMGKQAREAIPELINLLLKDPDENVRYYAAVAIGEIEAESTDAIESVHALIESLKDESEVVRVSAVYALGRIGNAAEEAIPYLTNLINTTTDENIKRVAIGAFDRIKYKK